MTFNTITSILVLLLSGVSAIKGVFETDFVAASQQQRRAKAKFARPEWMREYKSVYKGFLHRCKKEHIEFMDNLAGVVDGLTGRECKKRIPKGGIPEPVFNYVCLFGDQDACGGKHPQYKCKCVAPGGDASQGTPGTWECGEYEVECPEVGTDPAPGAVGGPGYGPAALPVNAQAAGDGPPDASAADADASESIESESLESESSESEESVESESLESESVDSEEAPADAGVAGNAQAAAGAGPGYGPDALPPNAQVAQDYGPPGAADADGESESVESESLESEESVESESAESEESVESGSLESEESLEGYESVEDLGVGAADADAESESIESESIESESIESESIESESTEDAG